MHVGVGEIRGEKCDISNLHAQLLRGRQIPSKPENQRQVETYRIGRVITDLCALWTGGRYACGSRLDGLSVVL